MSFWNSQTKTGKSIGMIISVYTGAGVYQTVVNSFLLAITAYNTSLRDSLLKILPWINFWLFFLCMVLGQLVVMWLHWKFAVPSIMAWNNKQVCEHGNPVVDDLSKIKKALGIKDE